MDIYIIGAGGHAKVVSEIAEKNDFAIIAFIDESGQERKELFGLPVLNEYPNQLSFATIGIGNNDVRKRISESISNFTFVRLIHPNSFISDRSVIGKGTVIMAGVSINSSAMIGEHCIINTNASVDHDCLIGDFVHLSPNVALAGNVSIGERSHIGIGACVIQGVKIGKGCTIGAGAVIIRDIPDGATVVGNPGKIIKFDV